VAFLNLMNNSMVLKGDCQQFNKHGGKKQNITAITTIQQPLPP